AHGDGRALIELHATPGTRPAPAGATLGLYHFAILLPGRASLGRFLAHLAARDERAGMSDHLVSEALYLADPDGLGIEVYADRPRSGWRHDGRELEMATEPLDARGVIAAGGGEPWTGMPPGTVIGHVHLHVGASLRRKPFITRVWDSIRRCGVTRARCSLARVALTIISARTPGREGTLPAADQARLLSWDLVMPGSEDAESAAKSLADAGHAVRDEGGGWAAAD
ncbi:MAG: glyoxalase, partial [Acidobacteriota bacterium]|nr:glyoxalase [Acidobacteriota bacterium]